MKDNIEIKEHPDGSCTVSLDGDMVHYTAGEVADMVGDDALTLERR